MRSTAVVAVSLLLLLGAWVMQAGAQGVPIEGKLLVNGTTQAGEGYSYVMAGDSTNTFPTPQWDLGEVSPFGTHIAYTVFEPGWPSPASIWYARMDGSEAFDITGAAGLGAVSCYPSWSPDGTKVGFQHAELVPGLLPCESGFDAWIASIDGTNAHRLLPEGSPHTYAPVWSPDGHRLVLETMDDGTVAVDVDGTNLAALPNVGGQVRWSADGSHLVSVWSVGAEQDGEPGRLRQLVTTDAEGGNPNVLVEQFLPDSLVQQHLEYLGLDPSDPLLMNDVAWWAGPLSPQWSPRGDRIAFIAALPLDPLGLEYKLQTELWMYDLPTGNLTRVTDDSDQISWLSWNGPNTSPEDPSVTVDGVTVTFSAVWAEGLTTILVDGNPPALPSGYQFCAHPYKLSTTAAFAPPITLQVSYRDDQIPGGIANEPSLALLRYNETSGLWENATTSADTANNVISGEVASLSPIAIAVQPTLVGFASPIRNDGSSSFKAGSTIPVKFSLKDALGNSITDAVAHLSCGSNEVGPFTYDATDDEYSYDFGTKGLGPGAYELRVTVDGWPGFAKTVLIRLR